MSDLAVIEHREPAWARNLRRNRFKIAIAIGAVEGLLVVAGVVPWWAVVVLAAVALSAYLGFGRQNARADVRGVTWVAAVTQLLVVLVPIAVVVATALAVVVVVLMAIAALVVLLRERL
jgi:hypothetical protein